MILFPQWIVMLISDMQMVWGNPCERVNQSPKGITAHQLRATALNNHESQVLQGLVGSL